MCAPLTALCSWPSVPLPVSKQTQPKKHSGKPNNFLIMPKQTTRPLSCTRQAIWSSPSIAMHHILVSLKQEAGLGGIASCPPTLPSPPTMAQSTTQCKWLNKLCPSPWELNWEHCTPTVNLPPKRGTHWMKWDTHSHWHLSKWTTPLYFALSRIKSFLKPLRQWICTYTGSETAYIKNNPASIRGQIQPTTWTTGQNIILQDITNSCIMSS